MANKDFNDYASLFRELEKQAASVLKNEIAKKTIQTMQKHVQTDVYDAYSPVQYSRQGYDGGLIDERNIEVEILDDNTISVENIRFDGDREVAQIVESGQNYTIPFEFSGVPRPFTENTRKELHDTGILNKVMADGLRKRGLDIR